jgi:hypothetical protein
VSIGQCFNFKNYTVFSGACTQNNNTESPNLWLSHLQNGVFSYFISIVIILGPPTKLAQTPLPLEDTIHFGGVRTTIILFSKFQDSRNKRKIVFEWEYAVSDTNRTAAMSMMMGNNPFQMMESIISGNSGLLDATLTRRVELRFEDIAELRFDHGTGTSTRHNNQDVLQIRMYSPPKVTQRESFGSKIFIDKTAETANGQTQLSSVYTFSHLGWGRKRGSIATAIETLFHRDQD